MQPRCSSHAFRPAIVYPHSFHVFQILGWSADDAFAHLISTETHSEALAAWTNGAAA
jgi:hypothetical protein